jgi:predicted flap endonuclease-1-like 5' DNA nuclease
VSFDDSDLISGWRYSATLQLRTPLAYLERDGEFSPGPEEPQLVGPAENFLDDGTGFNPYGIWLRQIDYGGMGFTPPPPGQRAAQWGMVRIGSPEEKELLSFLKSFRYIVETAETMDQKLAELADLSTTTPANRRIWQKARASDPGFPDSFFYGELSCLPGVGPKVAERLYRSGFRSVEEIQAASDEDLLMVEGVGKGLLRKLRELFIPEA